jgi:hypothetical protein
VDETYGAGSLVQVVDILGAKKEAVAESFFELGESEVGGVGLGGLGGSAAGGVELPDQGGIAVPSFGGAYVLDTMASPEAIGGTECRQAAFGTDACSGEYEEAVGSGDGDRWHLG